MGLDALAVEVGDIFAEVYSEGWMDLCDISRAVEIKDAGGRVTNTRQNEYENIPCVCSPKTRTVKDEKSGKLVSIADYALMLPRKWNDELLDLKANDQIIVQAREDEPLKKMRIVGSQNQMGAYLNVICLLEN